ncbi:DNA translocase FtsK [Tepidanaerobacter syntrophicus]|uniref:DNA segregation ATPase FtsK/SpoIIIE, S-DNA-T family n=1 Tax=Tepidanaerobacter syntrophicus TaxID=224999 RepID=A0A0U9HHL5_9FIRM|nr:DNA translocase FtsK [Tepidanaerobacter syntrophicus]GAQ26202.1 DNA segregation ATPase FtsK/SpoIIIE, S-DNA-T family [Tepidanaerobacter syntrophicus]GLI19190.1 DNA translocase FtsK [Tepidanaerobacter syntrophicus]GLI50178.1 DNA translocase FtsK [Tepidanaerobacter syntrophicus]HHV83584.1 DNA translocase FtsK [Tepidanaerobacter syntrophicus]
MAKSSEKAKIKIKWEIKGIILISLGLLGIFSLYTDGVGAAGILISKNLKGLVGQGALLASLIVIFAGIYLVYYKKKPASKFRAIGLFIIFTVVVTLFHLRPHSELNGMNFLNRLRASADMAANSKGGGIFGEVITSLLINIFGTAGLQIVIVAATIIGIILLSEKSLSDIVLKIRPQRKAKSESDMSGKNSAAKNIKVITNITPENEVPLNKAAVEESKAPKKQKKEQKENSSTAESEPIIINEDKEEEDYKLPPVSLLSKSTAKQSSFTEKELLGNAEILENTLESFGIDAKVVQVNCGPTITRFEVQPSPGVKVSRIVNLADDIALSLAASDVRIEAPIPGKAAVGIEVPNKKRSSVFLRDVIESAEFTSSPSKLTIALGKDVGGNSVVADLADMPHLLIAGATGSGKSVCINTIIASILYKALPSEVKLMMIDPKVVELAVYDGIAHLISPVVTDVKKAAAALNWIVEEMERRYQTFAKEGVRDIAKYNETNSEKPMPQIVVIIDELADLMMISPREIEDNICRLAQMARAAGIHLVVATQRPSVDIITGLIKANIPSRISFAVSSQVDSRTILDTSGAEKLLGKGDMLFFPVGAAKPLRIQGAFISEAEVEKLVNFIKNQKEPLYEKNLSDFNEMEMKKNLAQTDELFEEAVSIVLENGQASISMLQRRLKIGYARAARLIDEMEERGFISGYDGPKPREILITKEYFQQYFNKSD